MKPLKALITLIPSGKRIAKNHSDRRRARLLARIGNTEDRFTHIYQTNKWNCPESRSGFGSTAEYTRNIRKQIPDLFRQLDVSTVLDAPCGDYNWFRLIDRGEDVSYLGGDIVKPLIAKNRDEFQNANTRFVHLDIIKDELPHADLWILRDCLLHLCSDDIFSVIDNFFVSNIRYLLTSTHPDCEQNIDIPTGHCRLLNLEIPPFNFCPAQLYIDDWVAGGSRRYLALWERQKLQSHLVTSP